MKSFWSFKMKESEIFLTYLFSCSRDPVKLSQYCEKIHLYTHQNNHHLNTLLVEAIWYLVIIYATLLVTSHTPLIWFWMVLPDAMTRRGWIWPWQHVFQSLATIINNFEPEARPHCQQKPFKIHFMPF